MSLDTTTSVSTGVDVKLLTQEVTAKEAVGFKRKLQVTCTTPVVAEAGVPAKRAKAENGTPIGVSEQKVDKADKAVVESHQKIDEADKAVESDHKIDKAVVEKTAVTVANPVANDMTSLLLRANDMTSLLSRVNKFDDRLSAMEAHIHAISNQIRFLSESQSVSNERYSVINNRLDTVNDMFMSYQKMLTEMSTKLMRAPAASVRQVKLVSAADKATADNASANAARSLSRDRSIVKLVTAL